MLVVTVVFMTLPLWSCVELPRSGFVMVEEIRLEGDLNG